MQVGAGRPRKRAQVIQYGLEIVDGLPNPILGNADRQRDLSVSYEKIGDVQVAQGDLAGALKSYSDSFAINDRLGAIRSEER